MKKFSALVMSLLLTLSLASCASPTEQTASDGETSAGENANAPDQVNSDFDTNNTISIVSREDGSGTRSAFIELFGVEASDAEGNKTDRTTPEATIIDKTAVMMNTVANDPYAIGYISLGSLNDTVKAIQIDGVDAGTDTIKNGSYTIQRPFNIATKGEATGLAKDFIDFILSAEGQSVVAETCIPLENAPTYSGKKTEGKITVGGSSSVSPVMQQLKEAYEAINTGAEIVIDETDSDWKTFYVYFDFNTTGDIDIADIVYVAKLI